MRFKYTVVALLIAVVSTTTTMPVTGQEEPLPAIQARGSLEPLTPSIVLAVYPIRDLTPRTSLLDAARANDYAAFDALYRDAVQRGERVGGFAALHELWTFSMTDPIGAFYGQETYERYARAYPGFARYIADYRIVDRNGNAFYPTSETRSFLLDRAVEGGATRVQVAERGTRSTQPSQRAGTPASSPAERAASRRPASAKTSAPARAAARDAAGSAGEDARVPQTKAPAVVVEKAPVAVVETAVPPVVVAEQPAAPPVEQPVVIKPAEPATVAVDNNNFGTRGIFLLLVGIFGIGILAMMLRAPRELPASIMTPPAETTPPPVEPIRRPSAATPPPPSPTEKNRASGSHG